MSEAVRLLHALSQALAAMSLYSPGHPAARRSSESVWEALTALLAVDPAPTFFFLGMSPVYAGRTLHELRDWPWSRRLASAGLQRLEFDATATPEAVTAMLDRFLVRLTAGEPLPDEAATPLPGIRFGAVTVEEEGEKDDEEAPPAAEGVDVSIDLTDELAAMDFVWEEAARGAVARAEAEAIIRILGGVLDHHHLPQAEYEAGGPRYSTVHAINTALLAMVAGSSWLDRAGRQRIGTVALLHDIGMARLPAELADRDALSAADRAMIETHPAEGARLILEHGGRGFELAAVVAFEHHLRPDGTGYPARRFRPAVHWASRLVGTCAAFTALRAPRPFRPAWTMERAVGFIRDGAGSVFDAEATTLLLGAIEAR